MFNFKESVRHAFKTEFFLYNKRALLLNGEKKPWKKMIAGF